MLNSFPKWLHHIYGYYQCTHVQMLHILKNILHCLSFHFNHSAEYVAVSFVTNDSSIFWWLMILSIFSCAYWLFTYSSFQKHLLKSSIQFFLFVFFLFFGQASSMWKFLGQGSDQSHTSNQSHCSDNPDP